MPNLPAHSTAGQDASGPVRIKARLFDADRTDREVDLDADTVASLSDKQLLWVDAISPGHPNDGSELLSHLRFDPNVVERIWAGRAGPRLEVHGDFFLIRLVIPAEADSDDRTDTLDVVVGKNVVLTIHRHDEDFLDDLDSRIKSDTALGDIDSADFATVLLDGVVTRYLSMTDEILALIDELDTAALRGVSRRDLLADLVDLRHRIARTRRVLVAHRTVFAALAGADFQTTTGGDTGPRFDALIARFESAVGSIDGAREALVGTFDIHMSRTAQRTNDVMKTLTIVSVLLLPTGVIAGFMGMNLKAPYSTDDPRAFWIVIVTIVAVAVLTIAAFRARKWL